jgi:molybdate transport system substrate-binding protein
MDLLQDRDMLAPGTRRALLSNRLVLVAARGDTRLASVEDLAAANVRVAMADPDLAPAGVYAREALQSMGLWDALAPRTILGRDVRAALGYVKTGNVDAAIVYRTDVVEGQGFDVVAAFPAGSHAPISYPGAVLSRSSRQDAALAFLTYLSGETGRQALRDLGFVPLE